MKNRLLKKGLVMLLLAGLLGSETVVPAWGAEEQPDITSDQEIYIEETDLAFESDISENNNQGNREEGGSFAEDRILTDPSDDLTDEAGQEKEAFATDSVVEEAQEAPEVQKLRILDKFNNETVFEVRLEGYKMPVNGSSVVAAVWSDDKGQDDLKFYQMSLVDGAYTMDVNTSEHRSVGNYNVHMYLRQKDGKMIFLDKSVFEVHSVTVGSVQVVNNPDKPSTAKLILSDVACPCGVSAITAAVWGRADQADLFWYTATKQEDGTWTADLDYANHTKYTGNAFNVHIYGLNSIGANAFAGKTTAFLERGKAEVFAVMTEAGLKLSLTNCTEANPTEVRFAVWSNKNGQDDLIWYRTTDIQKGSATITVPHPNETDVYQIHCYAKNTAGNLVFQKKTEYVINEPSAAKVEAVINTPYDGSFKLKIIGIENPYEIKEISVPVWCSPDQSDMKWYKAVKDTDGSWFVDGSIANHKYHAGTYQAHVYIKDYSGKQRFNCNTVFVLNPVKQEVTAEISSDHRSLLMKAKNIQLNEAVSKVQFAVWTDAKGQDDLRWYSAPVQGGLVSVSADLKNHSDNGILHIHAYAVTASGKLVHLNNMQIMQDNYAEAVIQPVAFDQERISGDIYINVLKESIPLSKVEIAAWSAADQSDLHWYNCSRSEGNNWYTAFSPVYHKGNEGMYKLHAYGTLSNGMKVFLGTAVYSVKFDRKPYIISNTDGTVTATYPAASLIQKASVAVWSKEGGQDDLRWYTLTKSGSAYNAVLSIKNHKHNGDYLAHFYIDGKFAGAETFRFPETIGNTQTLMNAPHYGGSDAKFFRDKIFCTSYNGSPAILNKDGSLLKAYPGLDVFWFYCLEAENLILYSNTSNQLCLLKLDNQYNIQWKRTIFTFANRVIDPSIVKTSQGYMITATEIKGKVNNSDPSEENGLYTIHSWTSQDLVFWMENKTIISEKQNLEDVDLYEKDGIVYLVYENEILDKGKSSICVKTSSDFGKTWSQQVELLPADADHEPAVFTSNGDQFILFYSCDRDNPGTSYSGAKAYYAIYDKNLRCIIKDQEIKTGANGVLFYDVKWIDSTHYILYAEDYLYKGSLVLGKAQ